MHIPGQEKAGRYVIIQMDNGEERLNLREVKAFGRLISTSTITLHQPILNINVDQADDIIEHYAESTTWPAAELPLSSSAPLPLCIQRCRNPFEDLEGVWCYTTAVQCTDPDKECDPGYCSVPTSTTVSYTHLTLPTIYSV